MAAVDVLSGGRLNPGVSVGPPMHWDDVKAALYPETADAEDFSYERVLRLLRFVAGEAASSFRGTKGIEQFSDRVQPYSPGLRSRLWYGRASRRSAAWAGERGMNFLTSNVVRAEESEDLAGQGPAARGFAVGGRGVHGGPAPRGFAVGGRGVHGGPAPRGFAGIQRSHIRQFRSAHPTGRVSQGLVVIPTDGASPAQREKYAAYVAGRTPRTAAPQGPGRLMFARDLVGPAEQIAAELRPHAGFQEVAEAAFALPFTFDEPDYVQILADIAARLGPVLGRSPAG